MPHDPPTTTTNATTTTTTTTPAKPPIKRYPNKTFAFLVRLDPKGVILVRPRDDESSPSGVGGGGGEREG